MNPDLTSRPRRLAARLRGEPEAAVEHLFHNARVLVRLELGDAATPDDRMTFLEVANQILRFCPNVTVGLGSAQADLAHHCQELAEAIHGPDATVAVADIDHDVKAQATVNVGRTIGPDASWMTVNSTGWVARVSPGDNGQVALAWSPAPTNPLGALAAACLGSGHAFLRLAGLPSPPGHELSLLTGETGVTGTFPPGPPLPESGPDLNGLLVGCGAVSNGWARAMASLPVSGCLWAVDRQSLRPENVAPYVLARAADVGRAKAEMMREIFAGRLEVVAYPEDLELFKLRLRFGLNLPPIVVAGLDRVRPRHSLQRLWPNTLIDMAAGGTTAQVLVHRQGRGTQCLLGALTMPPDEQDFADEWSGLTGLRPERIREDPTGPITDSDVKAAPPELRAELDQARRNGQPICGRITEQSLHGETASEDFAPAAPFVTALSGMKGASETIKALMAIDAADGLHWQYDFRSGNARSLVMECAADCECLATVS